MKPKLLGGQMMDNGFFGLWMLLGIVTAAILPVGLGWGVRHCCGVRGIVWSIRRDFRGMAAMTQPKKEVKQEVYCPRCGEPRDPDKTFCSELCALNNMVSTEPWRITDA